MDSHLECHNTVSKKTSERLKHCKESVLKLFESRSRERVSAATDKDSITVRDELAKFIDELINALSNEQTDVSQGQNRIAVMHGQQRSGVEDYTLKQVIREYGILRDVLIDVLLETGSLSEIERKVIHRTIDSAIELAANEFSNAEKAKIKLAMAELEKSNRDLDQIAEVLAHDLRSPLGTIAGFAELLEDDLDGKLSGPSAESMAFIKSAVARMTKLIDQVLVYAKLKGTRPEFAAIDCNDVVFATVQNLRAQLTQVNGRTQHDKLPIVSGDFVLLAQVFQNLFSNALKFRKENTPPHIYVSAKEQSDHWLISVEDNGKGFDPKNREFIFVLYNRLADKSNGSGAGIGLATCRRVIELHGGRIWAESEPGKGATFFFTLPKFVQRPLN